MRYKEFKKAVEVWGRKYNYNPVIDVASTYIEIAFEDEYYMNRICAIHKSERFVLDLNWNLFINLSDNEKRDLFKIVTELAATKPADREEEKRFIIPLPGLVTTDGKQQYLTHKDCKFFASRRDATLIQTWEEEQLKFIPDTYRQFAVEFDEEEGEEDEHYNS